MLKGGPSVRRASRLAGVATGRRSTAAEKVLVGKQTHWDSFRQAAALAMAGAMRPDNLNSRSR